MRKWALHSVRFLLVTAGVIILTSITIDATDTLRGSHSALSILADKALENNCPSDTVRIDRGAHSYCIDEFENSTGSGCAFTEPETAIDTKNNIAKASCQSAAIVDAVPWTFVTFHQAKELCARRGMRLPTSDEWYEAALGTPVTGVCNTSRSLSRTGVTASCVSLHGAYDMVGNVWEWVDETIADGVYQGRQLPDEGYVSAADADGVATMTTTTPSVLFDKDYFWTSASGTYAMMRGGFYGSSEDAGLYAVHTKTTPSFASAAIGFRCVYDL